MSLITTSHHSNFKETLPTPSVPYLWTTLGHPKSPWIEATASPLSWFQYTLWLIVILKLESSGWPQSCWLGRTTSPVGNITSPVGSTFTRSYCWPRCLASPTSVPSPMREGPPCLWAGRPDCEHSSLEARVYLWEVQMGIKHRLSDTSTRCFPLLHAFISF